MRIEVAHKQCRLEEDKTGDPHRGRPAKHRQQLLGRNGFDEEKQEGSQKNGAGKQRSQPGHAQPQASRLGTRNQP